MIGFHIPGVIGGDGVNGFAMTRLPPTAFMSRNLARCVGCGPQLNLSNLLPRRQAHAVMGMESGSLSQVLHVVSVFMKREVSNVNIHIIPSISGLLTFGHIASIMKNLSKPYQSICCQNVDSQYVIQKFQNNKCYNGRAVKMFS